MPPLWLPNKRQICYLCVWELSLFSIHLFYSYSYFRSKLLLKTVKKCIRSVQLKTMIICSHIQKFSPLFIPEPQQEGITLALDWGEWADPHPEKEPCYKTKLGEIWVFWMRKKSPTTATNRMTMSPSSARTVVSTTSGIFCLPLRTVRNDQIITVSFREADLKQNFLQPN